MRMTNISTFCPISDAVLPDPGETKFIGVASVLFADIIEQFLADHSEIQQSGFAAGLEL